MNEVKVKKYKGSTIFKISIFALIVFVLTVLINQHISISEMNSKLKQTNALIDQQILMNEELKYSIEQGIIGGDAFAEKYARSELDYAKQGEKVFVNIGGN